MKILIKNILVLLFYCFAAFAQQVVAQEQQKEKPQQEGKTAENEQEGVDEEEADDPEEVAEFERFLEGQFTERDTSVVEKEPEERLPFISIHNKVYADSIVIRWAPSDRKTWLLGNKSGYLLERVEYELTMTREEIENADDVPRDYAREVIRQLPGNGQPILPYDSAQWAPYFPNDDKYALVAAGATAGSLEVESSHGFAVQGQQNQSIFGIILLAADLSPLAADGLGFRYVDTEIEKGKNYEYRVSPLDSTTMATFDSLRNLDARQLLAAGDTAKVYKLMEWQQKGSSYASYTDDNISRPASVEGVYTVSGEKQVAIRWSAEPLANEFSGYFIERSHNRGQTWNTLTNNIFIGTPIEVEEDTIHRTGNVHLVYEYLDLLDTNYVEYSYRIRGVDAFGDESLTTVVKGIGRDLTPPANPVIKSGEYLKKSGEIQLTYDVPEVPDDLTDLYFEYAYHVDSAFVRYESETLDPHDSVYRHAPEPDEYSHYFRIVAEDSAKNRSHSFPIFVNIPDTIPPPVPTEIHAKIDSTGEVEIKWTDEHVDELGFLGYRVYYSNSPTHEFSQLTTKPIIANFYIYHIPLNTLTDKIYYKVQAVDKSYNHSEFSEVAEAVKPDTLKPSPPVFKNIRATEQSIDLFWALSSSHDVVAQRLIRRQGETTKVFDIENPRLSMFSDTTTQKGMIYEYSLQAIDDNQLESNPSFPIRGKMIDKKRMEMVSGLKGKYDKSAKEVSIQWEYAEDQNDYRFVIFRNKDSEKVKSYRSVGSEATRFSENIKQPGSYYYAIKVIHKNGSKSQLSDPVKIKVN